MTSKPNETVLFGRAQHMRGCGTIALEEIGLPFETRLIRFMRNEHESFRATHCGIHKGHMNCKRMPTRSVLRSLVENGPAPPKMTSAPGAGIVDVSFRPRGTCLDPARPI
jgi:hypothetical protein